MFRNLAKYFGFVSAAAKETNPPSARQEPFAAAMAVAGAGAIKPQHPAEVPSGGVKQRYFVSMGEMVSHAAFLPEAVKVIGGEKIPLTEIPFEKTRSELIDIYASSIDMCVHTNGLKDIAPLDLASHYLFLVSLIPVEENQRKKRQLANLVGILADHLKSTARSMWDVATSYTEKSEYPIIRWLKYCQTPSNFMLAFIFEHYRRPFTRDQNTFVHKFKETPAFLLPNPIYMAWVAQCYEVDSRLSPMYRDGSATHYYHGTIVDNLLLRTEPKQMYLTPRHYYREGKGRVDVSFRYEMKNTNFLRIQGRTLLFTGKDGEIIAVKVQKKGEPKSTLTEEFQVADYLHSHQHRLDLQSQLPKPLGQYTVKRSEFLKLNKSANYEKFISLIGDTKDLEVYVYQAPRSYFTYLHDERQSIQEFTKSMQKNVHDLFVLLREGIVFPQLADIFHTHFDKEKREDKGRYQALVQLLNVLQDELGRIDKWQKAVEFVNLRGSGLADLGDSMPLDHLFQPSDFTIKYHSELLAGGYHKTFVDKTSQTASSFFTNKRKLFGNYLHLNTIAEYLLVVQLTIGSYGAKLTTTLDQSAKEAVWKQLAELMFNNCAEAVTLMTGMPQSRALALLKQRASLDKHFRQTQFWMTPDYAALDTAAMRSQQYSLYAGESGYEVRDELVPGVGLSLDGTHQDLGGYNQASPLKELEKLLYATVTLIEGTMQLDKQFFQQLQRVEKMLVTSGEAYECYQAAARLLEMARTGCHFQRRLALSYYEEIKLKYPDVPASASSSDLRLQATKREEAAVKIQSFWRSISKKVIEKVDHDVEDQKLPKKG